MRSFTFWMVSGALGAAGCAAVELERPNFDRDATIVPAPSDAGEPLPDAAPPIVDALPTVRITAPESGAAVAGARVRIEGESGDDHGVASVFVRVGPNVPVLAQTDDNFAHWSLETDVPQGTFFVEAEARDSAGQRSNPERVSLLGPVSGSDDAAPSVQILAPPDGSTPVHALVLVQGSAADDRAVVSLDVWRNGELLEERRVETDDFFQSWSRLVPLLPGLANELVFVARDAAGHEGSATITLQGRAEVDRDPPALEVTAPEDAAQVSAADLEITGSASDAVGVREVKVRVGTFPGGGSDVVWGDYTRVETEDGYASWHLRVPLPSGAVRVEARAIDLSGLAGSVSLNLVNSYVSTWSEEVDIPLRLRADTAAPTLRFELDREGVNEVIVPDVQRDIKVLELDTTALLTDALDQIKTSCGTRWRENNTDPQHDCTLTELGRSYGANWRQSPEYSLVRILTMTPANVVVTGTSIAQLEGLANALNIGGGFHPVLAETLGIPMTREIVTTPAVVTALKDSWLASHPAVTAGGKLPITLHDAMQDLGPLPQRFGPSGAHPGLLDPSFTPHSEILGPNFRMTLAATSNLRWLDGVDLSGDGLRAQKDYIAVVSDLTGPTYNDVLEFNFNDPARFDVTGLVAAPTVDLRMRLLENDAFVKSCTEGNPCKNNLPTSPYKDYGWTKPRWELERILIHAAREDYRNRAPWSKTYNLIVPAAEITVGSGDNPLGWATFETLLNLGSPPPDQYLWELILEVAQVAQHRVGNTTIAEGAADVAFTLRDVDVGLTAEEIRSAMRPELQAQRQTLSDKLLGDYAENNGAVDFFYRRGADNTPYLFFAAASDPRPTTTYGYDRPGFFADPELENKLSSTAAGSSGDSVHEKLRLQAGETTLYMRDETGETYRLRCVVGADPTEIRVFVARKVL